MDYDKSVQIKNVFTAEVIANAGVATSDVIDVSQCGGQASMQLAIGATGSVTITQTGSNDGTNYVTVDSVAAIAATKTNGKYIYSFTIPAVKFIKIIATETGVGEATITVTLAVR